MKVYADNAATTKISEHALQAMMPAFREHYGNPSSLHTEGQRAAEVLHGQPFMGRELMVSAASERPEQTDKPEEKPEEKPEDKPAETPDEQPAEKLNFFQKIWQAIRNFFKSIFGGLFGKN